jgi:hypothetical protein
VKYSWLEVLRATSQRRTSVTSVYQPWRYGRATKNTDFKLLNPPIDRLLKQLRNRTYISKNPPEQIEIESMWVKKVQTIFEDANKTISARFLWSTFDAMSFVKTIFIEPEPS